MSSTIIPSCVRIAGVLMIAAVAVFPPPVATIKAAPLDSVLAPQYASPPLLFDDAPASITRKEPKIDPSVPLIRCYCDLDECLAATGGIPVCRTRQGCFSKIQTSLSDLNRATTARPAPEEFDNHAVGEAYGCLDLLLINQTCNEILKLTEDPASEFPFLPSSKSSDTVHAYHCCQDNMCNDRTNPVATPIRAARQAINAVFHTSMVARQNELVGDSALKQLSPSYSGDVQNNGAEIMTKTEAQTNDEQTSDPAMLGKMKLFKWLDSTYYGTDQKTVSAKTAPVVTVNGNQMRTEHEVHMNTKKTSDLAMLDKMKLYKWLDSTNYGIDQMTGSAKPVPVAAEYGNNAKMTNVQLSGAPSTTQHSQDNTVDTAPDEFPVFSINPPIYCPPANDMPIATIIKAREYQKNKFPGLFDIFNGPLHKGSKVFPAVYPAETGAKACNGLNHQSSPAALYE